MTEAISDTHVSGGTMTSPKPALSLSAHSVSKFADEPEFTKTLCLTPSHSDHSRSNSSTCLDCVKIGRSARRKSMTASTSVLPMLFLIRGQSRFLQFLI